MRYRMFAVPTRHVAILVWAGMALVASCTDDSRLNVQSPPAVSTAATSVPTVPPAVAGRPECPVPPDDVAPRRGDCTLLERVEIDERNDEVSLRVVVGFTGDDGASCPTALGSRSTSIELAAPLGARRLLDCRPVGSFAPKGGYDTPEPRDSSKDCTPQP